MWFNVLDNQHNLSLLFLGKKALAVDVNKNSWLHPFSLHSLCIYTLSAENTVFTILNSLPHPQFGRKRWKDRHRCLSTKDYFYLLTFQPLIQQQGTQPREVVRARDSSLPLPPSQEEAAKYGFATQLERGIAAKPMDTETSCPALGTTPC